jgi:hypothetical protein
MVNRATWLVGLLVFQVSIALVGVAPWAWATFADEAMPVLEARLPPETPRPIWLEAARPLVTEVARDWDEDARLALISAQIDWPVDAAGAASGELPSGGWLTYVFVRETAGGAIESLSVQVERYGGAVTGRTTAEWGGEGLAPTRGLDLPALAISSEAALVAAEAAGGAEFRRACPAARHLTRVTLGPARGQGGADPPTLVWLFGYRDVRDRGQTPLFLEVDAMTGEVAVERVEMAEIAGCPG